MKYKYKDLGPIETYRKLINYSFRDFATNKSVYSFCKACEQAHEFFEAERIKLIQMFGKEDDDGILKVLPENMQEFANKFAELCDTDLICALPLHTLTEEDFEKENYNAPKNMWLTGEELDRIMSFSKE